MSLPLPEEEGAYIFLMKQVSVSRNLKVIKKMCTFEVHLCPAHKVFRDRMTKKCMQFHVSFLSEADEM
jgi:hypothetical protein